MLNPIPPESRTLPDLAWEHLQLRLVHRLRDQAVTLNPAHPWGALSDEALVRSAGLASPNPQTGELLFNVAALLLLGTDKALAEFLPHHKTQAQFRPGNWRRGSRTDYRRNLLETHDVLMKFVADHLPEEWETDPSGTRVNVRDAIFSELFTHSLVYRDYRKSYTARIVVESDRVFLENGMSPSSRTDTRGPNPLIAAVFEQVGLKPAGAAGGRATGFSLDPESAVARWGKAYFGLEPIVITGSVYRIIAPFPKRPAGAPAAKAAWDISEMFTTQAPWTRSIAAQNEVAQTRSALEDLLQDPLLAGVKPVSPLATPLAASLVAPLAVPLAPTVTPSVAIVTHAATAAPAAAPTAPRALEAAPIPSRAPVAPQTPAAPKPPAMPAPAAAPGPHSERVLKILEFCKTPRYRSELQHHVGIVNRDYFRKDILNPLIEQGLLYPTLPDKPNSPKQQYATVIR